MESNDSIDRELEDLKAKVNGTVAKTAKAQEVREG